MAEAISRHPNRALRWHEVHSEAKGFIPESYSKRPGAASQTGPVASSKAESITSTIIVIPEVLSLVVVLHGQTQCPLFSWACDRSLGDRDLHMSAKELDDYIRNDAHRRSALGKLICSEVVRGSPIISSCQSHRAQPADQSASSYAVMAHGSQLPPERRTSLPM